ncbi:hypothetical protein Enr13x_20920 [Stieleria neptunia]|uniref:DNA-binding protein n=1 Tax=Stieleria neptunia TaxID=2527979 RepID=A0A518HNA6_9BACT|nr:hypothetical protein [Stieleria neptunia]QDV42247.1 hypothetical protein Enr13x_20920 [Stieleria neptunia]
MPKRKKALDESLCPITSDPKKRLASDTQTDAIKANFPAGIARPALRALVAAGFTTLEQLTTVTKDELSELHGMGPKAVNTLHAGLLANGLDFRNPSERN